MCVCVCVVCPDLMPNPNSRIGGGGAREILPTTENAKLQTESHQNPRDPDLYTKRQQESYKDLETRKLQKNT